MRNLVYAFDRSFEGALAALGSPLVGIIAHRVFGFEGEATSAECEGSGGTLGPGQLPRDPAEIIEADLRKADALANSMVVRLNHKRLMTCLTIQDE